MSILETIGKFVALEPAGSGSHKGICPFHKEQTPSFHVNESEGKFHCFGCGLAGSEVDFFNLYTAELGQRGDAAMADYHRNLQEIGRLIQFLAEKCQLSR